MFVRVFSDLKIQSLLLPDSPAPFYTHAQPYRSRPRVRACTLIECINIQRMLVY